MHVILTSALLDDAFKSVCSSCVRRVELCSAIVSLLKCSSGLPGLGTGLKNNCNVWNNDEQS